MGDLEASAEMCEKADELILFASFGDRTMVIQHQHEREDKLVSSRAIIFALVK